MNTLPIASNFRVLGKRDPLSGDVFEAEAPYGLSVREVIGCDSDDFAVAIDDESIPPSQWGWRRPLPNQTMLVCAVPRDDGVRQLLMTAAVISAAVFGGGALAAQFALKGGLLASETFWAGTIMAASSLMMQALVCPPRLDR